MPIPSTPSIMPNVLGYAADTVQIPETTPTGQGIPSFRDLFPFITQVDPDAGGVMVERSWMNALFNLLGQHAFFQQSGCVYPWQATLNYIAGSHVKGSDDVEYIALQHSGPDVSGTGAKDPTLEANRNYWISLSSFVSGDFVPDSRRVIAGTGLTGGGPLSSDVTLSAKLDRKTTQADADGVITAKDVAIGGDLGDLASARGQVGPARELGDNVDYNTVTKAGFYLINAAGSVNGPIVGSATFLQVFYTKKDAFIKNLYQIVYAYSSVRERMFLRQYRKTSNDWSPWSEIVSSSCIGDGLTVNNGIISVPEYEGATASAAGTSGLVPPAAAGQQESFLTGGGEYKPALSTGGGTVTGNLSIKNILDLSKAAPATEQEFGLFMLDKNGTIMGAHDFVHNINNIKAAQMYARNSSGLISSLGVYVEEDGTRYTLSSHNIILTSDVEIGRLYADGVRLITFSGTKDSPGLTMRYSPDNGELYLDGRAVHGKADSAGSANALTGMDMIIARTTYTLPEYGTWKYSFTIYDSTKFYDQVVGESPGGTTFSPTQMGWPESAFMDGLAFRSA